MTKQVYFNTKKERDEILLNEIKRISLERNMSISKAIKALCIYGIEQYKLEEERLDGEKVFV